AERTCRRWVLRVVRGEWTWPTAPPVGEQGRAARAAYGRAGRRGRLLVCDPRRRSRVGDLWDEPWMCTARLWCLDNSCRGTRRLISTFQHLLKKRAIPSNPLHMHPFK
ncbi:hypothetical protein H4582DRAFT_1982654, partial [Lactarius indigo]